jgi:hypothetical protein
MSAANSRLRCEALSKPSGPPTSSSRAMLAAPLSSYMVRNMTPLAEPGICRRIEQSRSNHSHDRKLSRWLPEDRAANLVIEIDFLAIPKMQKFRCYLSAGVNTRRYGP